jgi:hypothetical protein
MLVTRPGVTAEQPSGASSPTPQAAQSQPVPEAPKPEAPKPAPERVVHEQPTTVLGQAVHGADGANLGRIVDILVDQAGKPLAAVIDFGGFMGLGNRKIAVAWSDLHFDPTSASKPVTLALTLDQLKAAPEYKGAEPQMKVVGTPHPKPADTPAPAPPAGAAPKPD